MDGAIAVEVHQIVHGLKAALLLDETVLHVFRIEGVKVKRFSAVVHRSLTEEEICPNHCMNDYQFSNSSSVAWRKSTLSEGVEVKDLGTANGRSMQLVKFAPGTSFPIHTHAGPEFIYVLEGVAFQEGQQLDPGWAAVATTGTIDTKFWSPSGCIFLTVYSD